MNIGYVCMYMNYKVMNEPHRILIKNSPMQHDIISHKLIGLYAIFNQALAADQKCCIMPCRVGFVIRLAFAKLHWNFSYTSIPLQTGEKN
jgi:hypothetical protein